MGLAPAVYSWSASQHAGGFIAGDEHLSWLDDLLGESNLGRAPDDEHHPADLQQESLQGTLQTC